MRASLRSGPPGVFTMADPGVHDDRNPHEEAQRLEKVHAEHRAYIAQILQDHRNELRAQSEADAARTAQILRDLLAEHRTEVAQAAQTHADQLAQILSRHQQHTHTRHETPDDALRSALIEQSELQRDANEAITEHIGALTTIVADLGQTVGMLAVTAAQRSSQTAAVTLPILPPPTTEDSGVAPGNPPHPPVPACNSTTPPTATPEHATASPDPYHPPHLPSITGSPTTTPQTRILQCVDDNRDEDDLAITRDNDEPSPRPRLPQITPFSATRSPPTADNEDINVLAK